MSRLKYFLAVAALFLFITAGVLSFNTVWAQESPQPPLSDATGDPALRSVQVTGQGQASAPPDQAVVLLGVQTEAEEAAQALEQNNQQLSSLIDVLRGAEIPSEDIQTQGIRLSPRYDSPREGTPEVVGYVAENILEVRIRDIDRLGELLDAAVQAGGNRIQGIRFELSSPGELTNQAREDAWQDAQQKAEQLAILAGASLGEVITIRETSDQTGPVGFADRAFALEEAAVPVEPGSQSVSIQVNVTWRLQDGQSAGNQLVTVTPASGAAGSNVEVTGEGFDPNTEIDLGVGPWGSEYSVVEMVTTDDGGRFQAEVQIPESADPNERWVVVAVPEGDTRRKVNSNYFNVTSGQ